MNIYPKLLLYWVISLVMTVLAVLSIPLDYLLSFVLSSTTVDTVMSVISALLNLGGGIILLYVLYQLRNESERFPRAFAYQLAMMIFSVLAVGSMLLGPFGEMWVLLSLLLLWVASLFSLISSYHLYWALDERVIPFGYLYPARRIRWCFYFPLLCGAGIAMLQLAGMTPVALVVEIVAQVVPLVLLRQYNQAVKHRENNPLTP